MGAIHHYNYAVFDFTSATPAPQNILIRPKQIMTLFPVGRPGHFSPNSETFFGPKWWQCHVCKCTQRVITQSNLNRIPQSKHLQGSRDSQLSARKPPGSIRARITELEGLELFA